MDQDQLHAWNAFLARPSEITFTPVYEQTRALVWTLCYRILGREDAAHDAFQSVYCRLLAEIQSGVLKPSEPLGPQAILYRLAVREAHNLRMRDKRLSRREIAMDPLPTVKDGNRPADQIAAERELKGQLDALIRILPEENRLPLQLHYFHGLSQDEIARIMNLSQGTISRRLASGLKKLTALARRAGLGEALAGLTAMGLAGTLIEPPSAMGAGAMFVKMQAMNATGVMSVKAGFLAKTLGGLSTGSAGISIKFIAAALITVLGLGAIFTISGRESARQAQAVASSIQGAASHENSLAKSLSEATPQPKTGARASLPSAADMNQSSAAKTKTPAPTPAGPMQTIACAVVWQDDQTSIAQATVVIRNGREIPNANQAQFSGTTGKDGRATVQIPQNWDFLLVTVDHPDVALSPWGIQLPPKHPPVVIKVQHAARIFGTVRLAGTQQPAAGARILTFHQFTRYARQSVISGPDGRYEIGGLPAGPVTIKALLGEMRSDLGGGAAQPIQVGKGIRIGPIDLELSTGGTVQGQLLTQTDHRPISGATIRVAHTRNPNKVEEILEDIAQPEIKTDPYGHYSLTGLPTGQLDITAQAEGYARQIKMIEPDPASPKQCDFTMEPEGIVDVQVTDIKGAPVMDARVYQWYSRETVRTDASGHALLRGISVAAPSVISVYKNGFNDEMGRSPAFVAGKTSTSLSFRLTPLEDFAGVVTGRVTDEKGTPLPGIEIAWRYIGGTRADPVVSDAQGRYRLLTHGVRKAGQVEARGKTWATAWHREVLPGTAAEPAVSDFVMKPAHWLTGLVVDEAGRPLPKMRLTPRTMGMIAEVIPQDGNGVTGGVTGADGRFRLERLPGPMIRLQIDGDEWPDENTTEAVDRETRIIMKSYGHIKGRVIDQQTHNPIKTFTVMVEDYNGPVRGRGSAGQSFTSGEGRFEIPKLTQGNKYTLHIQAMGYLAKNINSLAASPAGSSDETLFELSRGRELHGLLLDQETGKPVEGATIFYCAINKSFGSNLDWSRIDGDRHPSDILDRQTSFAGGAFQIKLGSEPGALFIKPPGYQKTIIAPEDLQRRAATGVLVIRLKRAATLQGRLLIDGVSKSDRFVDLVQCDPPGLSMGSQSPDDQGRFIWDGLAPGQYLLKVGRPYGFVGDCLIRRIEVKDREQKEITIGDAPGDCALFGRVLDQGQPVTGVIIDLVPQFDWEYTLIGGQTDARGVFTIQGLKKGKYRATILQFNTRRDGRPLRKVETVEIGSNMVEHDFDLSN